MTSSILKFQLIIDSKNIFLSTTPEVEIRANITELDQSHIKSIVEDIRDAGPDAIA